MRLLANVDAQSSIKSDFITIEYYNEDAQLAADIANAVSAAGIELQKQEVRLPVGPIRQTGEYDVDVHLPSEVKTQIRVNIIAEA